MEHLITNTPNCQSRVPITNADRIRGMTDEELATLLSSAWNKCDYEDDDYDPAWLDWLRQPSETEGME